MLGYILRCVEAFWKLLPSKPQWVLAYYAEFGGDMVVHEKPLFRNCSKVDQSPGLVRNLRTFAQISSPGG